MDCYWLPWSAGDCNHRALILSEEVAGGLKVNEGEIGLLCECFSCKYITEMSIWRLNASLSILCHASLNSRACFVVACPRHLV
jgi:hypothetical protein